MFLVSTHARYALRALQYIAGHPNEGFIPISRIAREEAISKKYLENIFKLLKKSGIVRSVRGPEGGYTLARDAKEITLWDVVAAAEGNILTSECIDDPELCERYDCCTSRNVWKDLQDLIEDFLQNRTLEPGE